MSVEKKMERAVLEKADFLITNTPVMLENFLINNSKLKNKELSVIGLKNKFSVIPNGYDEEDFKWLDTGIPKNDKFTLTYTGALYGRRRPDLFFKAVTDLVREKSIEREKISINLIGHYKTDRLNSLVKQYGLSGVITVHPYMEHRQCLQKLLSSDALLLLEGSGPGSGAFYTGKVFEYMNTNRPIIAVIPENGAAAGLIRETGTGSVSDCGNLKEIKQNVLESYSEWLSGSTHFSPDRKAVSQYERKNLTAKLAGVFEKAIILSKLT
jgi:glycosyltransferase involved in cell wall biosynthesis